MVLVLPDRARQRKIPTWLATPAIIGALVFTAGWLIAGRLQEHYNPRSDYISSLAAVGAADPWIMILALVVFGVGVMFLGAGLVHVLPGRMGRLGSMGIVLSGVGVFLAGSMRHDCGVQLPECSLKVSLGEVSGYHAVHDVVSGLTFVVAGVSQILISLSVSRQNGWRYLRVPSMVSGALTLVLFTLMISALFPGWVGAIQRTIAVLACVWVSTFAVYLYRASTRGHPPDASVAPGASPEADLLTLAAKHET
ncbi:DUF998 domain-containing protein [Phytoactinopolyspora alkaliphila]|uniref:DUF998 domain-containing protein n=1 Tax=Phytoactinopolyspora alkaliphila TaxID=1783498 RepID=A0A6N9YGV4_9ACTN|nr:DUF998 domain-containing protein [Phytoactinopolyspora alkaliphila]NED94192.1 DUF998 domain-containing protein [Phytoactinopolyspora alkaliphila]